MQLWQASLLSAAVHAGILALPALEPPERVERKRPREVQLVKLPPPEDSPARKTRMAEAHRPGTPGRHQHWIAPAAKAAPPTHQKISLVQRTIADARRAARASARLVVPPREPGNAQPRPPAPAKTTMRTLSAPDGTTVVARLTRTDPAKAPSPSPSPSPHDPDQNFTLGQPVPFREPGPSAVRPGRPGQGVFGVGGDIGTVTITVGDGGGDVSPRLALIQKRIDSVVAMLRSARRDCPGARGFVRVEFQIQQNGYPAARRLRASSGDPCLEDKAGAVIHLAEPYPYVSGWVPVTMDFN